MEVITSKKFCIITPLSQKLGVREAERIKHELNLISQKDTGIDLSYVKDCTVDFLETLLRYKNVSLFNISADIFALFTFMKLDKKLKLYATEEDFLENKRRIISRELSLVRV